MQRRVPIRKRYEFHFRMRREDMERMEVLCLKKSMRAPFKEYSPSMVARFAVLKYLEEEEAREAASGKRRPPCLYADCVGGLRWCPEHDARWEEHEPVPASCRGDE